ncbi:MAG: hypothetical protein AB7I44_13495 [Hyphomicrobiaceae bacterium]
MTRKTRLRALAIATLAGSAALLGGDASFLFHGAFVTPAAAIRGRPATPLSYAGVARRTTRRAYAVGAATTTRCVQVVDAYGRIVTRCR